MNATQTIDSPLEKFDRLIEGCYEFGVGCYVQSSPTARIRSTRIAYQKFGDRPIIEWDRIATLPPEIQAQCARYAEEWCARLKRGEWLRVNPKTLEYLPTMLSPGSDLKCQGCGCYVTPEQADSSPRVAGFTVLCKVCADGLITGEYPDDQKHRVPPEESPAP